MATTVSPGTNMRALIQTLLLSILAVPALSQAAEDPPSRVARLSHVEGEVSMAPAGTQEWSEAVVNRPLTSEDRLFVDRDARAELQVGSATIHLDAESEFSFIDLDDDAMTMNLTEGKATIRIVRKREKEDIEVNTPNASIALLRPGEYNIEVNEEGETTIVKTRSGEAEVAGEGKSYMVRADEIGVFRGSDELSSDINRLGPRTAFENWANDRARRDERSASSRYVGEGVIGYEDLDDNGEWIQEPEYGYVWRPTYVVAGWAPYRYGRWAYISPWGWTWIDDARWGFAPFHYGRWAHVRNRWCWVPGPRHIHAVYAPALVGWTHAPGVSVSVSIGSGIGWFPLGPREVYVPGYWHTRRYIHSVNVSNTIIVNNTYINNAYRGRHRDFDYRYRGRGDAVTVVDRDHFVRGRPVEGHYRRVDDRELRRWGNDARPPAIAPSRESVVAAQPRTRRSTPEARQVVARRDVPNRVNFDAERRAIEANGGRPVARTQLIDRSSTARSDVRVARNFDQQRTEQRTDRREGRAPDVATNARERSTENRGEMRNRMNRERDVATDAARTQATQERERDRRATREAQPGSAPSIESSNENPRGSMRRERNSSANSSDWADQQREQQRQRDVAREAQRSQQLQQQQGQEQSRAFEARQRDAAESRQREQQQREASRDAAREAQRERAQSFQQRERSYSQPERAQPRSEPQRVERQAPQQQPQQQRSNSDSGSRERGNQMRSERGDRGSRER